MTVSSYRCVFSICVIALSLGLGCDMAQRPTEADKSIEADAEESVLVEADPTQRSGSVASDRKALEALFEATGGPSWSNHENWKTSVPLKDWYGVTTDRSGRVVELDLSMNGLSGPIPADLGSLSNLRSLDLSRNWKLSGHIPAELGNLVHLQALDLADNAVTGPIPPELGNLIGLVSLNLDGNGRASLDGLTGAIPFELGNLANLKRLSFVNNGLSGAIPSELGKLSDVESLTLNANELSGAIPPELGELTNVKSLDLNQNKLSGPIPPELGKLRNVESLNFSGNELNGPIPSELANLAKLESLWLRDNRLSGSIPPELGNLPNLEAMSLSNNKLHGQIPPNLGNLRNLDRLYLADNELSGPIPSQLGDLPYLTLLFLDGNALQGPIPDQLWNRTGLNLRTDLDSPLDRKALEALYDTMSGLDWHNNENWNTPAPLQEWYGVTTDYRGRVTGLRLPRNGLTGTFPIEEIGTLTDLQRLDLSENGLMGPISAKLSKLVQLEELNLSTNSLSGPIPVELGSLANLRTLNLSGNALNGQVPTELGSANSLLSVELQGNDLLDLTDWHGVTWCTDARTVAINFRLETRKTLSICDNDGILTCFFGYLGAQPELYYSGPIVADFGGAATVPPSLTDEEDLTELAKWADDPESRDLIKKLAHTNNSNGFIRMYGYTGEYSASLYVFRNGSWQYEIFGVWGRTFNHPRGTAEYNRLAAFAEYWLTLRSPDGKVTRFHRLFGEYAPG